MKNIYFLLFIAMTLSIDRAMAATTSSNLKASATLNGACQITGSDMPFGEISPSQYYPGEFGVPAPAHFFPITYKCSPGSIVTVTYAAGTPEQPGDDPYTKLLRGIGDYGVLTGKNTGYKITYRLYTARFGTINPKTYTLSFDSSTEIIENVYTGLRESAMPPPDFYSDTINITLTY